MELAARVQQQDGGSWQRGAVCNVTEEVTTPSTVGVADGERKAGSQAGSPSDVSTPQLSTPDDAMPAHGPEAGSDAR
eukprot:705371-Rhodomonas_salina.1